jgi:hypothetical protein
MARPFALLAVISVGAGGLPSGSTRPIPPGGNADLVLNLHPGQYLVASDILYDRDLGLYATLVASAVSRSASVGGETRPIPGAGQ